MMKDQIQQYYNSPIQLKGDIASGRIWLFGKELLPDESLKHRDHSPDGFAWGYGGSGPAQLALAICLELFDTETALAVYQEFKWKYVAVIHQSDFEIDFSLEHLKPQAYN